MSVFFFSFSFFNASRSRNAGGCLHNLPVQWLLDRQSTVVRLKVCLSMWSAAAEAPKGAVHTAASQRRRETQQLDISSCLYAADESGTSGAAVWRRTMHKLRSIMDNTLRRPNACLLFSFFSIPMLISFKALETKIILKFDSVFLKWHLNFPARINIFLTALKLFNRT